MLSTGWKGMISDRPKIFSRLLKSALTFRAKALRRQGKQHCCVREKRKHLVPLRDIPVPPWLSFSFALVGNRRWGNWPIT